MADSTVIGLHPHEGLHPNQELHPRQELYPRAVQRPGTVRRRKARRSPLQRVQKSPWWVQVFLIWMLSRVVTTVLFLLFARAQLANAWTGKAPGYLDFTQLWDSAWYHVIAVNGYPAVLPLDAGGHVAQSAWAFLPGYPYLVRGLMAYTALPWDFVSVAVSVLFSLAAALMVFQLLRRVLPAGAVLFSVALFCFQPLSPILQVSYAESMAMFLLALALVLLVTRRYVWLFPVVALLCFTQPYGVALALALAAHVIYRFATRSRDPFSRREKLLSIVLTLFTLVLGFVWAGVAWLVTGQQNAYYETELAWRADHIGHNLIAPFTQWWLAAEFWASQVNFGWYLLPLLAAIIVAFAVALTSKPVKRLGVALRIWLAAYAVYGLAAFFLQSSIFRLLMPLFPLLGVLALPRSRSYRVIILVLFVAAQAGWLYICWLVNGYDSSTP
jgi:hypothetical protein